MQVDTNSIKTLSEAFKAARDAGYDIGENGASTFDLSDARDHYDFDESDPEVHASVNDDGALVVQGVDSEGYIKSGEALVVFRRLEAEE